MCAHISDDALRGKGGNVTSAGWQVTLCDPIWHVSSRSGEAGYLRTAISRYFTYFTLLRRPLQESSCGLFEPPPAAELSLFLNRNGPFFSISGTAPKVADDRTVYTIL